MGTMSKHKIRVNPKNKFPSLGKSLESGIKFVSITKNITSVSRIVDKYGILSPLLIGMH